MSFRILDFASLKPAVFWPSNEVYWTNLAFSADGRTLLRANGVNLVGIDTATWTVKWEVEDPPRKLKANLPKPVNLPDAERILDFWVEDPSFRAANADHSLCVVQSDTHPNVLQDMKTGKVLAHLETPQLRLERCSGAFSPRSTIYVMRDWDSQYKDGKVREINTIFAIPSGKRLCRLPTEYKTQNWSFSADESRVAFFEGHTGIIHVYNILTGKLIRQVGQPDLNWKWINATLALSPDGKMLAVWTEDFRGKVQIWDLQTGKNRWLALNQTDKGHVAACLAWSPDSRLLAVGGLDNSVRLWEVASAQVRREYRGHVCQARIMAFSPDGDFLASGSDDTTLLIWKVLTEKK
jgi:WD domain, G-beta repeat